MELFNDAKTGIELLKSRMVYTNLIDFKGRTVKGVRFDPKSEVDTQDVNLPDTKVKSSLKRMLRTYCIIAEKMWDGISA
jgi:hypothetical protein